MNKNNNQNVKIYDPVNSRDMTFWVQEKILNSFEALSYLVDNYKKIKLVLDKDISEDIYYYLETAIYNIYILYSFIESIDWEEKNEYKIVLKNGYDGFLNIVNKYNVEDNKINPKKLRQDLAQIIILSQKSIEECKKYILKLTYTEAVFIISIMYLGRDYDELKRSEILPLYKSLIKDFAELMPNNDVIIEQMFSKRTFIEYIKKGLSFLEKTDFFEK